MIGSKYRGSMILLLNYYFTLFIDSVIELNRSSDHIIMYLQKYLKITQYLTMIFENQDKSFLSDRKSHIIANILYSIV